MTRSYTVEFSRSGRRAAVTGGATILDAARDAGVPLNVVCGGAGTCGACGVRVVQGKVSAPSADETATVGEGRRLACRASVLGDVVVEVPNDALSTRGRLQVEAMGTLPTGAPLLDWSDLDLDKPTLADLRADDRRCLDAHARAGGEAERIDPLTMAEVARVFRSQELTGRVYSRDGEVIAAGAQDATPLGLAVDLGTTKIAAYIVDLESRETLTTAAAMNPQVTFGDDVISRIAHAGDDENARRQLQRVVIDELNGMVAAMTRDLGRRREDVLDVVLVGNTCIHHLVLGLPVSQLGRAPYVPTLAAACDVRARELGFAAAPGAWIHVLPNIAGFVGADHVAMILATGIAETHRPTLGIDIGTNTEVVLSTGERLLSCSTASGPAFEGAHVRDGMRAASGAIEHVQLSGPGRDVELSTIDDTPPVGICGSGIVDAVAELRSSGVLEATGNMVAGSHERLRGSGASAEFVLVEAGERGSPRGVALTRKDVNAIQLAKGAIRAGVDVLLDRAGLTADDLDRVVVSGAFGTYLTTSSALRIGLLPPVPEDRVEMVGNAAGLGARMALVDRHSRDAAASIATRVEYVELTASTAFVEAYTDAMMLP